MKKDGFFIPTLIPTHIFFRLKAMVKKAKSIMTLYLPKRIKRVYAISYFICPKTTSGSIPDSLSGTGFVFVLVEPVFTSIIRLKHRSESYLIWLALSVE